jgi:hypothetical protein
MAGFQHEATVVERLLGSLALQYSNLVDPLRSGMSVRAGAATYSIPHRNARSALQRCSPRPLGLTIPPSLLLRADDVIQ